MATEGSNFKALARAAKEPHGLLKIGLAVRWPGGRRAGMLARTNGSGGVAALALNPT